MNKYVIMHIVNEPLLNDYQVIEGSTPKEALKKKFNKEYKRLTGDDARYATITLVKGDIRGNNIVYNGRYQLLCFAEC